MKILYADSYFEDFDNKLQYYQEFDRQENTSLEQKLYQRVKNLKKSLRVFPLMGRVTGSIRVISLGKNKADVFSKIELHYVVRDDSIVFLHLYHTSMDLE